MLGFVDMQHCDFYPLKLADIKKVLHNRTMIQTHNCVEIGRRGMIWGFGKAQFSLLEIHVLWSCQGMFWHRLYTRPDVIGRHLQRLLKKRSWKLL